MNSLTKEVYVKNDAVVKEHSDSRITTHRPVTHPGLEYRPGNARSYAIDGAKKETFSASLSPVQIAWLKERAWQLRVTFSTMLGMLIGEAMERCAAESAPASAELAEVTSGP
jgi:hypothetical protein